MGIPTDEIGTLTLGQYDALCKRKRFNDNLALYNAGVVAAAAINVWQEDPSKRVHPTDFVPDWRRVREEDLTKMTPEAQRVYLMNMFTGGVKRR